MFAQQSLLFFSAEIGWFVQDSRRRVEGCFLVVCFVVCEIVCVREAVRMCGCQCIYVRPAESCASLLGQDGPSYATSLHTIDCVL